MTSTFPSYQDQFGSVDFTPGEAARSVYSPAAYLADLLQLLEDYFSASGIESRRPDIKNIPLDAAHTYSMLPYLDIVNRLLLKRIPGNSRERLRRVQFPLNLPFNVDNERIKEQFRYLGVERAGVHRLFDSRPEQLKSARLALGLAEEMLQVIINENDDDSANAFLAALKRDESEEITQVSALLHAMGISAEELLELLEPALDFQDTEVRSPMFTTAGLHGYMELDEGDTRLRWQSDDGSDGESNAIIWLGRVLRLMRLHQQCGISIPDLFLILRSCCHNRLDSSAIQTLAVIKQIASDHDLEIPQVCSLFSVMDTLWRQDNPPDDLFNRIYNAGFSDIDQSFLDVTPRIPASYRENAYQPLSLDGDILASRNELIRKRVLHALPMSADDLRSLVECFNRQAPPQQLEGGEEDVLPLQSLSLYYRIKLLCNMTGLAVAELLDLLDLLQLDPLIGSYHGFAALLEFEVDSLNVYRVLDSGSTEQRLWLVQLLLAISQWLQEAGFTVSELKAVMRGQAGSEEQAAKAEQQLVAGFNSLYQQFLQQALSTSHLQADGIDERSAKVLHESLCASKYGLVSIQDSRLLCTNDKRLIRTELHAGLQSLARVTATDFQHLGLEQKMQDGIFSHLMLKGIVQPDGMIIENAMAADEPLQLTVDIEDQRVFSLIHKLLLEHQQSGAAPEDFELLVSDLAGLELTDADSKILYENLILNGYLDEQGSLLRPGFFAENNNCECFSASTAIADSGEPVKALIRQKMAAFDAARCRIDADMFAGLPLNDIEVLDLLENLRFNDYLDEHNQVIGQQAVLELKLTGFKLALNYYPHRKAILQVLQQQLGDLKAEYYRVGAEDFTALAREMVAEQIFAVLQQHYLQEGWFHEAGLAFFADTGNAPVLPLGDYFDANSRIIVFKAVQRIIAGVQAYQLRPQDLAGLGLPEEERQAILQLLVDAERVQPDGSLDEQQTQYFLTINNALQIDLPDYADFIKDIFFAVHELAKRVDGAVNELSSRLLDLAQRQQDILLAGLQEMLEIPAEMIKVISGHIFGPERHISEHILAPVLSAVCEDGVIRQRPDNRVFNTALGRMQQFARLAGKLDLNAVEADAAFRDQSLAAKFPEQLSLPKGVSSIDCLLEVSVDGNQFPRLASDENHHVILLYSHDAGGYWLYDKDDYQLLDRKTRSDGQAFLSFLSPLLAEAEGIDAAFNDQHGNAWIIVGTQFYKQVAGQLEWRKEDKELGKLASNFTDVSRIDSAFMDQDDKLYLFAGDQYIRSADGLQSIDEGYPRKIAGNWEQEHGFELPPGYNTALDASFHDRDGNTWFFKDQHFVSTGNLANERLISEFWGKVNNNFANAKQPLEKIDAAFVLGHKVYFFSGDQCLSWSFSVENPHGYADEGSLQALDELIPGLPHIYAHGIDAIFRGVDDSIYLFKDGHSLQCDLNFNITAEEDKLSKQWGRVSNRIQHTGRVSAAFTGLDGKSYLFSGTQFFRYSSANYAYVDEGYPKTIADYWAGLKTVDAAFVLDGKTYLTGNGNSSWVRYSSNDYSVYDSDFPQPLERQWWSDHFNLEHDGGSVDFTSPDTVFIGNDGVTYLFKGKYYIAYDKLHRWWSEADEISNKWAAYDYDQVDAAFTGKDGGTYLFCGTKHLRYSGKSFNRLDDRYPRTTRSTWGQADNIIQKQNRIDAALVVDSATYLFSGGQYVRYSGGDYDRVDEGYPRSLAKLKDEARFENLSATLEDGIDAAFADQRNVYLFTGANCEVVSSDIYRRYENLLPETVGAVVQDQGKLYVEDETGWHQLAGLEGKASAIAASQPPLQARIAEGINGVSAVLVGVDDTAYVFKDGQCYNGLLEKSYPISEEWGRGRNEIADSSHIDAVLRGLDGKTYVFSGGQYCIYDLDGVADADPGYAAKHGGSIAGDWGGLENVHAAYVRDGKTYLLEAPDEDGRFRYVCYSGADYSQTGAEAVSADISWWGFPAIYLEEGFDRVDAVLFEEEHMYLFKDGEFIQYNSEEELWSYPRPVSRIWRNLPFDEQTGTAIAAAFADNRGRTWFFSDSHFSVGGIGGFSPAQKIAVSWGKVKNTLTESNRVDAAVVLDGVTYLFAGGQYVRYSGADYRITDAGYPKSIVGELRQESAFNNLPEDFDEHMATLLADDPQAGINGIAADERSIMIFQGRDCHVVSRTLTGQFGIGRLGRIRNQLQSSGKVDAAFVNSHEQTFLFSGDQYVRYSQQEYRAVDAGYPKSIRTDFANETGGVVITQGYGIDAIVQLSGEAKTTFAFKDKSVFSSQDDVAIAFKEWLPWPENTFNSGINAGFVDAQGCAYFFNGGSFIRYASLQNEFADEGFPRSIRDHWGNLPKAFETQIDHAFVFEGKTYLVRDGQYVRYSGSDYQQADALSAQAFPYRWGGWLDYALSDIHIISQFKNLLESNLSADHSLRDLLNLQAGYKKEPYKMLSGVFGWDVQEVKWLKRNNAFISQHMRAGREVYFNIELVLKMHAIFKLADKMGATPQTLYNDIYLNDNAGKLEAVDKQLGHCLRLLNSEKDWQTLSRELHDTMNQHLHDALLPYVIHLEDDVGNARDLFAKLLIDVNMGAEARTSEIKEAISALQLYIHRYFVNLEQAGLKNTERDALKDWWKWMRNYRVWEANRKVFLYPENYIRPELRDSKTPGFKKLEEALVQGEVTQQLVTTAFQSYLNEFAMVGNLKITGANVFKDERYPDDDSLVLFGHTRTEPQQYYYRQARFTETDTVLWGNWLPLDITINSTRVFPVYAFGRILLFWSEIEAYEENVPYVRTKDSNSKVDTSDTVLKHRAAIKYSFYDFNKQWLNPQTLTKDIGLEYRLDAAYADGESIVAFSGEFCLTTTKQNPQGNLQRITEKYPGMPFSKGIDASVLYAVKPGVHKRLFFKNNQCCYEEAGSWLTRSIDKVFLPAQPQPHELVIKNFLFGLPFPTLLTPPANSKNTEYQRGVGAAFTIDNKICLIDKYGQPTFFLKGAGLTFTEEKITRVKVNNTFVLAPGFALHMAFISIITRDLLRLDPIDAIFEYKDERYQHKIIYVLRKGQYECYQYTGDDMKPLEKLDGFPKPVKGNLSFNMDQFFNRLHLALSQENGEDVLNLNYTSPDANAPLLTGKIYDDFSFVEGDIRTDIDKQVLLNARHSIAGSSGFRVGTTAELPEPVAGFLKDAESTLSALIAEVDAAEPGLLAGIFVDYRKALQIAAEAIEAQDALLAGQDEEDEHDTVNSILGSAPKPTIAGEHLESFIELMNSPQDGVIAQLAKLGETPIYEMANALSESFRRYALASVDDDWQAVYARLKSHYQQSLASLESVSVASRLKALKLSIDQLQRNDYYLQSTEHANSFGRYFYDYDSYLKMLRGDVAGETAEIDALRTSNFAFQDRIVAAGEAATVWVDELNKSAGRNWGSLDAFKAQLLKSQQSLADFNARLISLQASAYDIAQNIAELPQGLLEALNRRIEASFGSFDIFPSFFGIENQSNFTFGEPDWHIFEAKLGAFLCRPLSDDNEPQYEIIRLTTRAIPELSKRLFAGGLNRLLSLRSQQRDEAPFFAAKPNPGSVAVVTRGIDIKPVPENTITYYAERIAKAVQADGEVRDRVPESSQLDFHGANSNYYWEIFFHAPFLIAQTLNSAQKFEDAKAWYEFIYNPAKPLKSVEEGQNGNDRAGLWGFLPFVEASAPQASLPAHLKRNLQVYDLKSEITVYLNDPFDPHAIARIREIAYQKAIVMRYVDNLLDWGDMLFRQYSVESINEARMLYVLAYDLLGNKPQSMGVIKLSATLSYEQLKNPTPDTDLLLTTEEIGPPENDHLTELEIIRETVHKTVQSSYFHIPENDLFLDYWSRVEDRLYKIRNSLNIDGIKQALPLFQPPIDPMSIVQSVAAGASLGQIMAGSNVAVPHYRFSFMLNKARDLVQKLNQFSGDLLAALEKRDAEQLSLMQQKQEAVILHMTTQIREAQIAEAKSSISSLQASLEMVKANESYNQDTFDAGFLPAEAVQMGLMSYAVAGHIISTISRMVAVFGGAAPDAMVGPFIAGAKMGGQQLHDAANALAELAQTAAEGYSVAGELAGIVSQHQRMMADVEHQAKTAIHDKQQIEAQIEGAKQQLKIAEYELALHEKQIEQQQAITTFMTDKFSNDALYQWMGGKLSGLYYQTYKMAYDMAKAAEKAFQFERGIKESEVNFISGMYWNSQRKGLLAGDALALDLERMEQAFMQSDQRRFEIARQVSLLEHDPMALVRLKATGECEFGFDEAFFDYDFQGHYCRQIKTIAVAFTAREGQTVNATLTQLNHKTLMEADARAVKYLLQPKDSQPLTIRSDWRASQQIVLSHVDEYEKPHGLFELRYDDDRYLPFEGTGAVSTWRLQLNGKRGSVNLDELSDVTITIKYTALQGGEAFADAVRGLLKPYLTACFIDFNADFSEQWNDFLASDGTALTLDMTRGLFPSMAGGRIDSLFTIITAQDPGAVSLQLNNDEAMTLKHQRYTDTAGLSVSASGSQWRFAVQGDKDKLQNVQLVVGYKAAV